MSAATPSPSPSPASLVPTPTLLFSCAQCKKAIHFEIEKGVQESALLAFNATFNLDPRRDLDLTESFVVLPSARIPAHSSATPPASAAATATPPGASPPSSSQPSSSTTPPVSSTAPSATNWDKQVEHVTRVLELVSDHCVQDQPLCTHCNEAVFQELDKRIVEVEKERETYQNAIQQLSSLPAPADDSVLNEEEKELERQEAAMLQRLQAVKQERAALNSELKSLEAEHTRVNELEDAFWREYQEYSLLYSETSAEQQHLTQQIARHQSHIDRLKKANVYDDAFHISYDGHFGTINNFRLGRLASCPIEWSETSAALGQVCLCVHTLARKVNYAFTKYKLIPLGSYSKMSKLDEPETLYELYGNNDIILGRLFWYRRFDTALVWLLACIDELGEYAHSVDPEFKLPYAIKNDMIGDVSIKLQFNNDMRWTKALKYLLTSVKLLLAWCAKREKTEKHKAKA